MNQAGITHPRQPVILLDLNYTLVANSPAHGTTPPRMEKRLANEQYRQWLVELVRPHFVILITARPMKWKVATLARIAELCGWQPHEAHFAPTGWISPPAILEGIALKPYSLLESVSLLTVPSAPARSSRRR